MCVAVALAALEYGTQAGKGGLESGALDRTEKLYIGGKQAWPDGGYSREIFAKNGRLSLRRRLRAVRISETLSRRHEVLQDGAKQRGLCARRSFIYG